MLFKCCQTSSIVMRARNLSSQSFVLGLCSISTFSPGQSLSSAGELVEHTKRGVFRLVNLRQWERFVLDALSSLA